MTPSPRTRELRLNMTRAEAVRLYARAAKRGLPISTLIRSSLGFEIPDSAQVTGAEPGEAAIYRLKIRVSDDEWQAAHDEAASEQITITNYLRRAAGLGARQNRRGAPDGNQNRRPRKRA